MNRNFFIIIICLIGISYGLTSLNQYLLHNKNTDKQNNVTEISNKDITPKKKNADIINAEPKNNLKSQNVIGNNKTPNDKTVKKDISAAKKDASAIKDKNAQITANENVENYFADNDLSFSKMPKIIPKDEIAKLKKSVKREIQKADVNRQIENIRTQNLQTETENKIINNEPTKAEIAKQNEAAESIKAKLKAKNENTALKVQDLEINKQIPNLNTEKPKTQIVDKNPINSNNVAEPSYAKIVVYTTNEGATVRIVNSKPISYETIQLKNPEQTIFRFKGVMHTQIPAIPMNRVLGSISSAENDGKTEISLKFKVDSVTVKYSNLNPKTLDIRIR